MHALYCIYRVYNHVKPVTPRIEVIGEYTVPQIVYYYSIELNFTGTTTQVGTTKSSFYALAMRTAASS